MPSEKLVALGELDFLDLNENTRPAFTETRRNGAPGAHVVTQVFDTTLLNALYQLFMPMNFNLRIEYYFSVWISSGWIVAQQGDETRANIIARLHAFGINEAGGLVFFRMARQLLALGLYRDLRPHCGIANCTNLVNRNDQLHCERIDPLVNEFIQNPLSLLQLARMEVRRSLGMNAFERRVRALPLPPRLRDYVWRANEMLAENALV